MDDKSGRFYGPIKGVGSRRDGSSALGFGSARLKAKVGLAVAQRGDGTDRRSSVERLEGKMNGRQIPFCVGDVGWVGLD